MLSRRPRPGQKLPRPIIAEPESVSWAYGVTTVLARRHSYFPKTLESLCISGFDNPVIFLDGVSDDPYYANAVQHPTLGQLGNWINSLFYLYTTFKNASRYALFEDDIRAVPNLKRYLESCSFPTKGYWNLVTHDDYIRCTGLKNGWHLSSQQGRGAVGLVFDRRGVELILDSKEYLKSVRGADGMVCTCMKTHGFKEYIHYPSLLQHEGIKSVLNHKYGKMKAFRFNYDPLAVGAL